MRYFMLYLIMIFSIPLTALAAEVANQRTFTAIESYKNKPVKLNTSFSFAVSTHCDDNLNDEIKINKNHVTLDVIVIKNINCAERIQKPSYEFDIKNNIVIFKYETFSPSDELTACECGTALSFTLWGDFQKYKVKVIENNK